MRRSGVAVLIVGVAHIVCHTVSNAHDDGCGIVVVQQPASFIGAVADVVDNIGAAIGAHRTDTTTTTINGNGDHRSGNVHRYVVDVVALHRRYH